MKESTKRRLKKLGKMSLSLMSTAIIIGSYGAPVGAVEPLEAANTITAAEGGKQAFNEVLKVSRSKPALSLAAGITCMGCLPAAGVAGSPALCVACGILIAKTIV